MATDYYKTLNLTKASTLDDIKQSFRKLSLKNHPDKSRNPDTSAVFLQIAEAYDVLSDGKKRAIYDQFGEEGLKNGVPARDGFEGFPGGYQFNGRADKIFAEFFGGSNPFHDYFNMGRSFGTQFGGMHGMSNIVGQAPQQSPPVEKDLFLTLEEIYNGAIKKLKISRKVINPDGVSTSVQDKVLSIKIAKGWREGTKITFPKEGDQGVNTIPADIVFTIKELPHASFKRSGYDLIYTANVTLREALTGLNVSVKTLDERLFSIAINDIITPEYTKTVSGEGFPNSKDGKKGDLIIRFHVEFPKYLTQAQKQSIQKVLE